jgi:hypothetical protein
MTMEKDLIRCADAYGQAMKISRPTLSTMLVNESRMLDRVAHGGSLTVRNWQWCMRWLSHAWPPSLLWPQGIVRPEPLTDSELTRRGLRKPRQAA